MEAILELAAERQLRIIEDAAHAHGGAWRGHRLGSLGDVGTFSFQASKNMTAGEGGAILTNNRDLAVRCRSYVWGGGMSGGPGMNITAWYGITG